MLAGRLNKRRSGRITTATVGGVVVYHYCGDMEVPCYFFDETHLGRIERISTDEIINEIEDSP